MHQKANRLLILVALTALPLNFSRSAFAAGFELLEQSSTGLGQAFAGNSTGFGDGSEVYFNPAAMLALKAPTTLSADVHFIAPSAQFNDTGSALIPQLGGTALSGNMGGDGGEFAVVPNIYATHKFNDWLAAGFGVNSPFGLSSDYNNTWVGRYQAVTSRLTTINLNPSVALQPVDWLSLGASMQIYYADAKLTNAVDFGTIGVSSLGLPTASALGLLPQRADGFAAVTGDDWGAGYGLSALITPLENLRLGVSFRSKVDLTLSGDVDFSVPTNAQVLTSTGLFTDRSAEASVSLPESIAFGAAYDVSPEWKLFADATWLHWSRFEELRVKFAGQQPDSVQDESWDNTWRFALGTSYKIDDAWTVRAGYSYDGTPIPDSEHRTPRIPDNDRHWMAGGVSYQIADNQSLAFSYAHLFLADAKTRNLASSTGALLNGDWDLSVDLATISYTLTF